MAKVERLEKIHKTLEIRINSLVEFIFTNFTTICGLNSYNIQTSKICT